MRKRVQMCSCIYRSVSGIEKKLLNVHMRSHFRLFSLRFVNTLAHLNRNSQGVSVYVFFFVGSILFDVMRKQQLKHAYSQTMHGRTSQMLQGFNHIFEHHHDLYLINKIVNNSYSHVWKYLGRRQSFNGLHINWAVSVFVCIYQKRTLTINTLCIIMWKPRERNIKWTFFSLWKITQSNLQHVISAEI